MIAVSPARLGDIRASHGKQIWENGVKVRPMIRTVISSSEIVGTIRCVEGKVEVCVTGEAAFDEAASQLVMELATFLRRVGLGVSSEPLSRDWLPEGQTVREHLELDEALPAAREIFKSWAAKVRRAIPTADLQPV